VVAETPRGEEAGFDSFWVMDQYHQIASVGPRSDARGVHLLGGVAARTRRSGVMVTGVT
jgi:alkanesulfonate monooxygenase SsuD/methylene tetrahydromethanopterin reductase-like flavin-dependent oxidoreductase (luciferase family)